MANLSWEGKQSQTTGRSPGLREGSHASPPLCRKQPACQGAQPHGGTQRPSSLARRVRQQFSQRQEPFQAISPIRIVSKWSSQSIHKQTAIKSKITSEGNSVLEGFITEVQTRAHMSSSLVRWNIQHACNKTRAAREVGGPGLLRRRIRSKR